MPDIRAPFTQRWYGRLSLLLLSTLLLTLAYAPISQFYLAWIGLVPWLIVIARCQSYKAAVFWGWLGGTMFFVANMWWMKYVTFPGMIGLMSILAAYWGVMGAIVRFGYRDDSGFGLRQPAPVLLIVLGWTALEFIRGNFVWKGLPWLYLGHTQTPILAVCQIADVLGVYGVTFWVVLINAVLAAFVLNGFRFAGVRRAAILLGAVTLGFVIYGAWRIKSTNLLPGPTVMVVQSNYPQDNSGEKGASEEEIFDFHTRTTLEGLKQHPQTDLIVWSETMMPPINSESRNSLLASRYPQVVDKGMGYQLVADSIGRICKEFGAGLITGGRYVGEWKVDDGYLRSADTRNSAYFFERSGRMSELRFDKIHIVPFGEFIPFKETVPWLYRLMIKLGPPHMEDYQLTPGDNDRLTVFPMIKTRNPMDLSTWRFVTPICFEDIDSGLTARMFRPGDDGLKRADVLVNLTNDGWFKANEMPQHLQVATFRSIENRVPTARSVNTGISGFIDSVGRTHNLLPVNTEGFSVATLSIDPRISFYTRFGDVFAWLCVSLTATLILLRLVSRAKNRV